MEPSQLVPATLTMISLENVSFFYPESEKPVLCGLTCEIERQSWVVITGPDGSGKTTLCKLLKGLLQPTAGNVKFDDSLGPERIGYLGGDPYDSLVGISVAEDVVFGLENLGLSQREMEERLEQALQWTGLSGMGDRLVHTLSGGQQQKLALAGALAMGSEVLIIDDALHMLDRTTRRTTRNLIDSLRKEQRLTVIETGSHTFHQGADRILFLSHGEVGLDVTPDAFASSELGSHWIQLTGGIWAFRHALIRASSCGSRLDAVIDLINKIKK